jgi:Helix-turn-helix domain
MRKLAARTKHANLLNLFDVALTLGISIATARRYALGGLLPSVRIAGRIRVPREAIVKAQREGVGRQKTCKSRREAMGSVKPTHPPGVRPVPRSRK